MDTIRPDDGSPHLPDPRARRLWAASSGLAAAVASAPLGVVTVAAGVWPLVVPIVLLAGAGGALFGRAAWQRRTWSLAPRALELERGVVVQRTTSIPYDRIQQIDVERGPVERVVGLSQLVVRTAAATTDANLYGLAPEDATRLRQQLLDLAGIDDVV